MATSSSACSGAAPDRRARADSTPHRGGFERQHVRPSRGRHPSQPTYNEPLIVDAAPTVETLRLLSFPEVARWWIRRLLPLERRVAKVVRPIVKRVTDMPLPDDEVFRSIEELSERVDHMRAILGNEDESSIRLVVNAEKMVIGEAQRTFTYLNLYDFPTDLVVCNRLLPDSVADPHFAHWETSQAGYLNLIEASFAPVPLLTAPLMDREVVGMAALRTLGQATFGDRDPAAVFHRGARNTVKRRDGQYVLSIPPPFAEREDISLMRTRDELIVWAGDHRRNVVLPRVSLPLDVGEAQMARAALEISFAAGEPRRSSAKKSSSRGRGGGGEATRPRRGPSSHRVPFTGQRPLRLWAWAPAQS